MGIFSLKVKSIEIPSHIDWREKGAVSDVVSQGFCRACWAFASIGAIESHYFIRTGKLVKLSAQNLIDCSIFFGNFGCTKGYPEKSFKYILLNKGVNFADSYPYREMERRCRFNRSEPYLQISGYVKIKEKTEESLMEAVAKKGPVVVAINTNSKFSFYESGVFYDTSCTKTNTNHVLLAVGYGTDKDEGDYWILKNSWGKYWGENGYIRFTRNRNNSCGIASFAMYPLV